MSDDIELTPAAPKTPKAPKAKVEEAPAYSKFLKSSTPWSYTDPESGHRFSPTVPVRIDAEPRKGSWLASQIAAGFIVEA